MVHIIIVTRDRKLQYEYISLGLCVLSKYGWGMYSQVLCVQQGLIEGVMGTVPRMNGRSTCGFAT